MMNSLPKAGELFDNHYLIIEQVGQGGMAVVFKAVDQKLNQIVAIKLMHPSQSYDDNARERFRNEAKAISQMQHPHVVKFHGFYFCQQMPYMVLEYIPKGTLQEKLRGKHRLPLDEATRIVEAIGKAIDHAHEKGIIHRDLKPANVMFNAQDQAILTDFGIAKIENSTALTATGAAIGSVSYMSPEQARGEGTDYRSDLYTLGVMFYEMVSGHLPFSNEVYNATLVKVATQAPPDIRTFAPDVPEKVARIVTKAMHPKRDKRYKNAAAFVEDLYAFISTQKTEFFHPPVPPGKNEKPTGQSKPLHLSKPWFDYLTGLLPLGFIPIAVVLCMAGLAVVGIIVTTTTPTPQSTTPVTDREMVEDRKLTPDPTTDSVHPAEDYRTSSAPTLTATSLSFQTFDFGPTPALIPTYTNTPTLRPTPVPTQTEQSNLGGSEPQPPTVTLTNRSTATMSPPTPMIATPVQQATPEPTKPDDKNK